MKSDDFLNLVNARIARSSIYDAVGILLSMFISVLFLLLQEGIFSDNKVRDIVDSKIAYMAKEK